METVTASSPVPAPPSSPPVCPTYNKLKNKKPPAFSCHIVLTSAPSFELQGGSVGAVAGDSFRVGETTDQRVHCCLYFRS